MSIMNGNKSNVIRETEKTPCLVAEIVKTGTRPAGWD